MTIQQKRRKLERLESEMLEELEQDLREQVRHTREQLLSAFARVNRGQTEEGNPVWKRAIEEWGGEAWKDLSPSTKEVGLGGLVRIGHHAPTSDLPGSELAENIPALIPLIGQGHVIFQAEGDALDRANDAIEALVFRVLTTVKPGKVRLVVADSVGLGDHFADLLNFSEKIRGPKFWHSEKKIADALTELRTHMANVLQKYLRNQYETIDAYNVEAGQVAEPYRLLLVSNFPAGFTQKSAESLIQIAENGSRVGVQLVMSHDTSRDLPYDFNIDKIERAGTVIRPANAGADATHPTPWLVPDGTDENQTRFPVKLDQAPPKSVVQNTVERFNETADEHDVVEVPFERFVPEEREVWQGDATEGVEVPVGRQGARDTLSINFTSSGGKAPHLLIGGQTGSGKSVLLHVLLTNLALHYPPDELEVYLVDFKEGVEFQKYRRLPHARVVAIQSEREFGLSVLEGLFDELQRRGDLFTDLGVDSIGTYREETGEKMPRVLLVIDEFQVLFDRTDKVTSRANNLLDALVRKGRSYGIHLVMASQTLAGMHMKKAILTQMGLRIALKMGEDDSRRFLSDENDEAKYLKRPGEAIFNDRGGLEGMNTPFQVAFADDGDVERYVDQVANRSVDMELPETILFDGNRPAELENNAKFKSLWREEPEAVPPSYELFLGEPTRLEIGHVSYTMRRQSRGNFLLAGNRESDAQILMLTSLFSAAVQLPGTEGQLYFLNLASVDDRDVQERFELLEKLPIEKKPGNHSHVSDFIAEVHAEMKRRDEEQRSETASFSRSYDPPVFLSLFGLQRARALEADGYNDSEETEQLKKILRYGPDLGVHTLAWVDTHTNLRRVLDKDAVAEFGGTVALDNSDVTKLLGNGVTSLPDLKPNYAYLATSEATGRPDKVRIYRESSIEWLQSFVD